MSLSITDQQSVYFSILDSTLDLCFALQAFELIDKVANSECDGCKVGHPSQLRHNCLMLNLEEKLEQYFNAIFDAIDVDEVFAKWEQEVLAKNIPLELVALYKLNVFCSDYKQTLYKSEAWKDKLYKDIRRMIPSESSLDVDIGASGLC